MDAGPGAGSSVAGYRLIRLLGQGSQSQVFLAEAPGGVAQLVALKLCALDRSANPAAARRAFIDSAGAAQRLSHPNIVTVLAAGVEGPLAWLAMEAVPGADLSRYTRAPRLLPEAVVLKLGERMAQGLGHAHRMGLVHRDLKPANVLVDWATDTVKLADFGLSRAAGAAHTGTGIVLGTPGYMAPEQLAGAEPTAASDLYALGATLYELLAGRLPHEGRSMGELLRQVSAETPEPLHRLRPGLPAPVSDLVARLLAKAPAERPSPAAAVAAALADAGTALAPAAAAPGAKSR
jgi:eukaryotic-like serine/threonine-protein kinase